jgi:hypothetical protein
LKGILGLGAYAILLNSTGQTDRATMYMNQAQVFGNEIIKLLLFTFIVPFL